MCTLKLPLDCQSVRAAAAAVSEKKTPQAADIAISTSVSCTSQTVSITIGGHGGCVCIRDTPAIAFIEVTFPSLTYRVGICLHLSQNIDATATLTSNQYRLAMAVTLQKLNVKLNFHCHCQRPIAVVAIVSGFVTQEGMEEKELIGSW